MDPQFGNQKEKIDGFNEIQELLLKEILQVCLELAVC